LHPLNDIDQFSKTTTALMTLFVPPMTQYPNYKMGQDSATYLSKKTIKYLEYLTKEVYKGNSASIKDVIESNAENIDEIFKKTIVSEMVKYSSKYINVNSNLEKRVKNTSLSISTPLLSLMYSMIDDLNEAVRDWTIKDTVYAAAASVFMATEIFDVGAQYAQGNVVTMSAIDKAIQDDSSFSKLDSKVE